MCQGEAESQLRSQGLPPFSTSNGSPVSCSRTSDAIHFQPDNQERTAPMVSAKTYPYLPTKAWWTLRQKFNQSIPPQVTPPYLVAVLGGKETSAKGNVLPALKAVGLVDQDGATTNRAKLWRDDASYADVCREIREEIYPPDLLNAISGPSLDTDAAKRWFMTTTGCGDQAARKMAAMYSVLAEAVPLTGDQATAPKAKSRTASKSKRRKRTVVAKKPEQPALQDDGGLGTQSPSLDMPEMRLNVEIRIDASVTPEQIDLIFESMARHLYGRDDERR